MSGGIADGLAAGADDPDDKRLGLVGLEERLVVVLLALLLDDAGSDIGVVLVVTFSVNSSVMKLGGAGKVARFPSYSASKLHSECSVFRDVRS